MPGRRAAKPIISAGFGFCLIGDPRFLTNPDRVRNRSELEAIVSEFFAKRTVQENLTYFEERGITVGPICDIADLIKHPYILGRQVVKTYADPDHGELPMHAPFPRLSETPATVRAPAPEQGQHSDEILLELLKTQIIGKETQ